MSSRSSRRASSSGAQPAAPAAVEHPAAGHDGEDGEDGNFYSPGAAGGGAARPASIESELNPFQLMEDALDKLKMLNYESHFFGRGKSFKPLHRTYFAVASNNPNEQFFYFTSLVSWLMAQAGHPVATPNQFDDPNATATNIVQELKKVGVPTDFPPSKLKQAHGDAVCFVLDSLCTLALRAKKFIFKAPEFPPDQYAEEAEVDEDADVTDMAADDMADEEEEYFIDQSGNGSGSGGNANGKDKMEDPTMTMVESNVDPNLWRFELERVTPLLKVRINVDPKDWRTHFEQMRTLQQTVEKLHPDVTTQLARIQEDIAKVIEKVQRRERGLVNQFEHLVEGYKARQRELSDTTEAHKKSTEGVTQLSNELNRITQELEDIKTQMDERGNKMTDTSPLVKIKESLQKLQTEIQAMGVRAGVIQNTLLQSKLRQRAHADSVAAAAVKSAAEAPSAYD